MGSPERSFRYRAFETGKRINSVIGAGIVLYGAAIASADIVLLGIADLFAGIILAEKLKGEENKIT